MGVTIHFEGQLIDETAYDRLMDVASNFAHQQGWLTETISLPETKLLRVRDEKDWDYYGPVKGTTIYPHEDCEPVRLEFDRDLYIQEYTKTQFSGAQIHLKVLELLTAIQPFFTHLRVVDEGEYWETREIGRLEDHLNAVQKVIEEECRKSPSVRVKCRTPEGRIIDLIT